MSGPARRHIVAMGGGGFSMEDSPLLDDYVLDLADTDRPKVCFVGTASGESDNYIRRFYERFDCGTAQPTHLSLFRRSVSDLQDFACEQDVIYVGGGNTANMLLIWREHGFDRAVRSAYESGTVLAGVSAGAICWFKSGLTDSYGSELAPLPCLGLLPGSCCPHFDGEPSRRASYHREIHAGRLPAGHAADDGAALHFVDEALSTVVTSRNNARAYHVQLDGESVREVELETRYLG